MVNFSASVNSFGGGRTYQSNHCSHCMGSEGEDCTCTKGCIRADCTKCQVVHFGIMCDGCREEDIQGPRYQCTDCINFDLCERCYNKGASVHDMTHAFNQFAAAGVVAKKLPARQKASPPKAPQQTPVTKPVPFVAAVPVSEASPSAYGFRIGDKVKLVGLQRNPGMNGKSATVVEVPTTGDLIHVRLEGQEPDKEPLFVKPCNLTKVFQVGQLVMLTGLQNSAMNGKTGWIEDVPAEEDKRVIVLVQGTPYCLYRKNLQLVDVLD